MTEQLSGSSDAYGNRIGRELRALSDKAIQPYDPEAIAHAVAVGSHARLGRRIELHLGWLRGTRALILAILILMLALLLAVGFGAIRPPQPQSAFEAGSIAFARDSDLYVVSSDGSDPTKVADGQPSSNEITKFAFSPDRRYLAFVRISDPVTGAETLAIASQDGAATDLYTGPGKKDQSGNSAGLMFGWAPDSARLAVYPGRVATEISIIDTDGTPVGALELPSGVAMANTSWPFFGFLAWSPDSKWITAVVQQGGALSKCPSLNGDPTVISDADTCYILLSTDGSGAHGSSDELSNYFAWAPDSHYAITHWYSKTVEIGRPDGSAPVVVALPGTTSRKPLTETNDGHVLAWSPDGTQVLVAGFDKWSHLEILALVGADGTSRIVSLGDPFTGAVDPASGPGTSIDSVAWSEDGQRLLFQGAKSGSATHGIWSVDVNGGPPTLLVETTGPIFDVADGRSW